MLSLCTLVLLPGNLLADTITVPRDYPTIQEATEASVNGDEIEVSPGVYYENISVSGKDIVVRSTSNLDHAPSSEESAVYML